MDFGDSPEEAAFRLRLREWLEDNNPKLPASSTDDDYWAGQRAWHQALYDGGFFGTTWPKEIGGQGLPSVYDVIVDEELAAAGAPPRPSLGYLVEGILEHGSVDIKHRFLPGIVNGRDRWCQGFSEPDAGSDLASLRTRAERDGDEYILTGHKVWTSYSDDAEWCLVLARTDPDGREAQGDLSLCGADASAGHPAAASPHDQRDHEGIRRGSLRRSAGACRQHDRRAGRRLVPGHDRGQPRARTPTTRVCRSLQEARQRSGVQQVQREPLGYSSDQMRDLGWAIVEADMLRSHVYRRLSERLDGVTHGPEGSIDKLLMTSTEQTVGNAALSVGGISPAEDDTWLKVYLYARAQSVMGGTSQIQRNLVAERILLLPAS